MKTGRTNKLGQWGRAWAWGWALSAACAWGGIVTPLYVGNVVPVLDQNGEPLEGLIDSDPALRARVEIRTAASGTVVPPAEDGTAHAANPLVAPDSIGGIGMNSCTPGVFAMVLPQRPAAGTKIFGRAFNAPTLAAASFYADTTVVAAPASGSSLVLTFGPAQPLDAGDADGDGLNNSWEKALGIDDRLTGDYDGDGMGDRDEMRAGTAPDDANSRLAIVAIEREVVPAAAAAGAETSAVRVRFQSRPGKRYQLECAASLLGDQSFVPAGEPILAGAGEYEIDVVVDLPADIEAGVFRLRLLEAMEESGR